MCEFALLKYIGIIENWEIKFQSLLIFYFHISFVEIILIVI